MVIASEGGDVVVMPGVAPKVIDLKHIALGICAPYIMGAGFAPAPYGYLFMPH